MSATENKRLLQILLTANDINWRDITSPRKFADSPSQLSPVSAIWRTAEVVVRQTLKPTQRCPWEGGSE